MDVKKFNRNRIFRFINSQEGVSKPEVAAAVGISTPTVLQCVKELKDEGYVTEVGEMKSTGGRKAMALKSTKELFQAVGVDITKNHVSIVITDLGSNIIFHERITLVFNDNEDYYIALSDYINNIVNTNIDENKTIIGVGISVPGIIDENKEMIVFSHALSLYNVNCDKFTRHLKYECKFINDANSAFLAEMYKKNDINNAVYLSLSNSVGGSIIVGNSSWRDSTESQNYINYGDNRRAGEFGHMTLHTNGKKCYCGKTGCLDIYCSALQLSNLTNGKLQKFFELIEARDKKSLMVWNKYLSDLAIGVNNLRMIFDCRVIIGGYVGSYMGPYLTDLKELAKELNTFEKDASYIEACTFKTEASATGASIKLIELFLSKI